MADGINCAEDRPNGGRPKIFEEEMAKSFGKSQQAVSKRLKNLEMILKQEYFVP